MNSDTGVPLDLSPIDQAVLERKSSFFAPDLTEFSWELAERIRGANVLLIGGAGTIGSATLRTLLRFEPRLVHVIDQDENGLAELVRSLRSDSEGLRLPELMFMPFRLGGSPFRLWVRGNSANYDIVLNFSALKHVRSEKDPFAILAMLETNVLCMAKLPELLAGKSGLKRVFSVSTDKAANPSSMMGATKRLMEHALFSPIRPWGLEAEATSARFANVAFSNGSLLQAWQYRLTAKQSLAVPEGTRRFFISIEESGHLCALASLCGTDRTLTVPALLPKEHLVLLTDVVARFLEFNGFEAWFTDDPAEATSRVDELVAKRKWPVLKTPLDTGGEKPFEEFVGDNEAAASTPFSTLHQISYLPPVDADSFPRLVATVESILQSADSQTVTEESLRALIATVEPAFQRSHRASPRSLDERM